VGLNSFLALTRFSGGQARLCEVDGHFASQGKVAAPFRQREQGHGDATTAPCLAQGG